MRQNYNVFMEIFMLTNSCYLPRCETRMPVEMRDAPNFVRSYKLNNKVAIINEASLGERRIVDNIARFTSLQRH